jgi:hypothetical protein
MNRQAFGECGSASPDSVEQSVEVFPLNSISYDVDERDAVWLDKHNNIWAEGGDSIGIGSTVSRRDSKGTTAIIPYIFIVIVLKIGTRRVCGSTIATVSSGDSTITGIGITITGGVTER